MSGKPKILVVEDEMAVAMMMVFMLTRAGHDVQTAWDPEKLMRLAQTEAFNLITLDIDMPGISGFEMCQRLKQIPHLKDTPVIFVSGRPTIENQRRAFELGAVDFIEKPFGVQDFLSRILPHIKETKIALDKKSPPPALA